MTNIRNSHHIIFISIILLNYFFPLLIFREITLFYHDNLDSIVVYNHVLGKIYQEGLNYSDIFLGGEIRAHFLRHFIKPFILLYTIFSSELAYWITDLLVKFTCYFSFFILANKITKKKFISCLSSTLFVSLNSYTTLGFGLAILPYIIYLVVFKSQISLKHYLILIFFGLNTDLIADIFFIPIVLCIIFIINRKIFSQKLLHIIKILSIFFACTIISSSNLIYLQFFGEEMHREEFFNQNITFITNLIDHILYIFRISINLNWTLFYSFPYTVIYVPLILFSFFSRNKIVKEFLLFIFLIHIFSFLLNTEILTNLRNNSFGLIKTFNLSWIKIYFPILYAFLFLYLLSGSKKITSNFLIVFSLISILLFQINSSAVPFVKKYLIKEENYRNLYTFNGYYLFDEYKEIKNVVKNNRVLSIGLDPMVAVMNNIKTIDGYHALYPLYYKKKFRKIIERELLINEDYKKRYDNWGSRVYAFVNDPNNILINFKEAKNLGANYIISKYPINSNELISKCENCNISLHLYQIK